MPDRASREHADAAPADHDFLNGPAVERKHLLDYVRVIHKRRWPILTAFALVVSSVALHVFTATSLYEARVQLLIEDERPNVIIFKDAAETDKTSIDYYQTQYRILESESMARRTLDTLKAWDHPEFTEIQVRRTSILSRLRRAGATLARRASGDAASARPPASEGQRIRSFLSALTIAPVKNSRLVDVIYLSSDPALAARVANTLAQVYIKENRDSKFAASKEVSDWLTLQLEEQRKRVQESEAALQRYRESNDALAVEDRQNIVVQKLADLNGIATRAKTDRIQKEAAYRQLESLSATPEGVYAFPAIVANERIQLLRSEVEQLRRQQAQLSEELGSRHPEMVKVTVALEGATAKLERETAMVTESVRNDFNAAQAAEARLAQALSDQKAEALALNRNEITYGVLQRDATSNQEIFQSLLQRTRETGISRELTGNNIRIVDAAQTPSSPVWPKIGRSMLLAIFAGAVLAIALGFFLEYVDKRVKTPDEIRQQLRLPFLGLVPRVRHADSPTPLINNGVPAGFAEAFRAVRTNVLFASSEDARSLLVTSTGPGEGKTVVAANLAIGLALTGQRVLLLDGDLRRPRVHEVFHVPMQPGLSELLVGRAKPSEAIRSADVPNLWVLGAGLTSGNPAELLSSQRFKTVLAALLEHYDWIVIDSPPVMAVTDASILSHTASAVLFVVTADRTNRANARAALDQLDAARATFVGAVLNGVDLERNAFFYSQYYRREYGAYYHDGAGA
jgi:succinoglycan biosynthesis transport protein ExoP